MKYTETTFDSTRQYELDNDSIFIKGKIFLKTDFEVRIQLSELKEEPQILFVRSNSFFAGIWLLLIPLIISWVLVQGLGMNLTDLLVGFLVTMSIGGLLLTLITFKKIKHVQFTNKLGVLILGIAKSGKDAAKFEEFISQLREAIRNAQP